MNFFEFKGIKIAGMATAVPDRHQKMSDYDYLFAEGEVEKFCAAQAFTKSIMPMA